jgi:PAS domain S-box-containing protein
MCADVTENENGMPHSAAPKVFIEKQNELLQRLVLQVSGLFDAKYTYVAKLNHPSNTELTTVAMSMNGRLVENIAYSIKNTPCASILSNNRGYYPNNVQKAFPRYPFLPDTQIESFLGYQLNDTSGVCLGMLIMLDDKPMQNIEQYDEELDILSSRAAAELERNWLNKQKEDIRKKLLFYVENNPMGFIECDNSFIVNEWNKAAEYIFGYQKQEAMGKSIFDLIFPDSETTDEYLHSVITNQNGRFSRTLNISATGTELTCDWYNTIVTSENGDFVGLTSLIDDVTLEQSAISKVAEQELEQRQILNAMTDAVFSVDDLGHIRMFNCAAEKLLGYVTSNIVGKQVTVLLPHMCTNEGNLQLIDFLPSASLEENGHYASGEIQLSHKNGTLLPVNLAVASLPNQHNFIICCHDLREYKKQQDQIRRSQKMDALGKLTGGIAHDFNNMLGVIQGYCELMRVDPNHLGQTNFIEEIYRASERGAKLTQKLLSFAKIQNLTPEIININQLLLNNQSVLERTLTSRVQVSYTLEQELWSVLIDSSEFEDLLLNLSINSMHAIQNTGNLFITTKNMALDKSTALALSLEPGHYILVSLKDTGCGIDTADIENIFEPFFTTKEYGNGLGLSQVYGFMKRSGGSVVVNSILGQGTTFNLYFPANMDSTEKVQPKLMPDEVNTGKNKKRVLIVDDEPDLLNVVVLSLRQYGYDVYQANDAQQALGILEQHPIDVMVSDVIMPNINGYELAKLVQSQYQDIKIQLVSGFNDDLNTSEQDDSYFQNLLEKPYKISELHQRICHLCSYSVTNI